MPMSRWYGGLCDSGLPSSRISPAVGDLEPGEHHQRRRLARARRAEQRQELAARDVEIEIVDDARDAVVGLADADEADNRIGGARRGANAHTRPFSRTIAQVSSSALPKHAIISSISVSLMMSGGLNATMSPGMFRRIAP